MGKTSDAPVKGSWAPLTPLTLAGATGPPVVAKTAGLLTHVAAA
jgi:hypothetical protein